MMTRMTFDLPDELAERLRRVVRHRRRAGREPTTRHEIAELALGRWLDLHGPAERGSVRQQVADRLERLRRERDLDRCGRWR